MSLVDTVRSTLVPIHREGWKFVAVFFVVSLNRFRKTISQLA